MTPSFSHRPLEALDLDLASALHAEAFAARGERGWSREEIAALLTTPGVAGFLLESNGTAIGFALCRTAADESELLTIAVRSDHRGRRAGRALLALVIELARKRGARRLFLEVGADNLAAIALYEKVGFQPVGRRTAYYSRGEQPAADAVVMRLDLDQGRT